MNIYNTLISKPHNTHYMMRYYNFIIYCHIYNVKWEIAKKTHYMETHHVCPKAKDLFPEYSSLKDYKWNKINLTARQHFIAHWLLWKVYGGSQTFAFRKFEKGNKQQYFKVTSKVYEVLKSDFSVGISNRSMGETNPFYGKSHTEETKNILRNKATNRLHTEDAKTKVSRSLIGNNRSLGYTHTTETKNILKKANFGENNPMFGRTGKLAPCFGRTGDLHPMFGHSHSTESKRKIAEASKNRPKVVCPHCNKIGVKSALARFHFDNCKNVNQ